MLLGKIWERYFLRELTKTCALFICCFYGLYVLIDYSVHASLFRLEWSSLGWYYLCEFVKRLDVLLPFALLIATIKTLSQLTLHRELVALMASGISLKTLLRPFLIASCFCVVLMYGNAEVLLPNALKELKQMGPLSTKTRKKHKHPEVQRIGLEDDSFILFQHYDDIKERFQDVYWIRSTDDIYHMKYLYPHKILPTGEYIDHFERNSSGQLVKGPSTTRHGFSEIRFNKKALKESLSLPEEQPLSKLWKSKQKRDTVLNEKEAQTLSVFYRKLAIPWLCLFAFIAPAPFCVQFTRKLPVFFIYAFSIFGLVAFYLIMNAAVVLGTRQIVDPIWAIWPAFALFFIPFLWRFFRLK